ncbi:MAG: nuclear transport factor 2 family protein [Halieaceae bacterium]
MFEDEHPARRAALLSREYVQTQNRQGWLDLYAEDAIIEDPIGVSMIDPAGEGHRGAAAREAFWDNFIAPSHISIEIHHSYAAGNEVANRITITTEIPAGEGKKLVQLVTGIFTYHVNEEGKLLSLRGYWETDDPANSLTEVEIA